MMKIVSGSFELYFEGFAPSITPPCEGALLPPVDVGTTDEVVADNNEAANVVDMALGGKKSTKNRS